MRKNLIAGFALWILSFHYLSAQNFSIVSTDAATFPVVKSTIQLNKAAAAQQSDFKVTENGVELPFTLTAAGGGSETGNTLPGKGSGRTVYFLVEASGATFGGATENFKKAVASAIDMLGENDKINIGYFGRANKSGRALNTISAEFTSDKQILKQELQSKVIAARDTNYLSDVFKSIYECLEFIESKQDLPGDKMLIVLSAAINNSRSPIQAEDCIDKAVKMNIPIYTITYKTNNRYAPDNFVRLSDRTNGQTQTAKTTDEISTALQGFITTAAPRSGEGEGDNTAAAQYVIQFTSPNVDVEGMQSYSIEYQGYKVASTYTPAEGGNTGKGSKWKDYALPAVLAVLAVGVLAYWLINQGQKKKAAEQAKQAEEMRKVNEMEENNRRLKEELRRQQQNSNVSVPPPVSEPQKHDLKKTIISGGGGAPVLMVAAGGTTKNYPINKMQMSIGRTPGNDIVLAESTVSGNHAVLVNEGGHFYIQDLGSTNGTYVNGNKITKQLLRSGDVIKMGAADIKFQI